MSPNQVLLIKASVFSKFISIDFDLANVGCIKQFCCGILCKTMVSENDSQLFIECNLFINIGTVNFIISNVLKVF